MAAMIRAEPRPPASRLARALAAAPLLLAAGLATAGCETTRLEKANADRSRIRVLQTECASGATRSIQVQLRAPRAQRWATLLERTQALQDSPTGGARLRDVDHDGVFEYEEIGMCGAGPNCEGHVYKVARDRRGMYLLFHGGYADFELVGGFYVESGRASCCSWEHRVYRKPAGERAIDKSDFAYRVSLGSPDAGDAAGAACLISARQPDGHWVSAALPERRLLKLCEVYGTDYVINPPAAGKGGP